MFRDLIHDLDDPSITPATLPETYLDVPYVPTDDAVIKKMLDLAEIGPKDLLYDLGSGDGRIVITAAKRYGARAVGVELDPLRVADAMENAADERVEFLVDFLEEDLFTVDFSEATVMTLYLLETVNLDLRPRILSECRPGTRIISHAFRMGDWQADEVLELSSIGIYKWIVPAKVSGSWEWEGLDGKLYRVELEQKYQDVWGKAWADDSPVPFEWAELSGNTLDLELGDGETSPFLRFTLNFENNELESISQEV